MENKLQDLGNRWGIFKEGKSSKQTSPEFSNLFFSIQQKKKR